MGNRASKIARRQYPAKPSTTAPDKASCANVDPLVNVFNKGVRNDDFQSLNHQLNEDEQKDLEFGSILDKLGGAISGRRVPLQKGMAKDMPKFKPAEPSGRVKIQAARAMLHDHAKLSLPGTVSEEAVQQLARKYGVNSETLQAVLKYNSLPSD